MAEDSFDVTIVAKAKHGLLWDLAKQHGGIKALAKELGVHYATVYRWITLRHIPMTGRKGRGSASTRAALARLEQIAKRPIEDIFPDFAREKLSQIPKSVEVTRTIYKRQLDYQQRTMKRLTLASPADQLDTSELRERIGDVLKTLSYREREIIKLRFGLGEEPAYTLEEVGHIFKVTKDRIRQIEAKAVRKLQQPFRRKQLSEFVDAAGQDAEVSWGRV